MNTMLPPERPLPQADRMLDRILEEAPSAGTDRRGRPGRGRVILLGSVAAGLAITATAVGFGMLRPGGGQLVGDPPPTSSGGPTVTGSGSPLPSPNTTMPTRPPESTLPNRPGALGTSQSVNGLKVSVTDLDWGAADGMRVRVQVCAVERPPAGDTYGLRWSDWQLRTPNGSVRPSGSGKGLLPDGRPLRVGACQSGWLPFDGAGMQGADEITFTKQDDGYAVGWTLADSIGSVGDTVTLPHLKVTVSSASQVDQVYVLQVTACVTSLPAGTTSVTLGWNNWSLSTSVGTIDSNSPLKSPLPLPTTFPNDGRLRVGQCASGALQLGTGAGTATYAVDFDDGLGEHAAWRP